MPPSLYIDPMVLVGRKCAQAFCLPAARCKTRLDFSSSQLLPAPPKLFTIFNQDKTGTAQRSSERIRQPGCKSRASQQRHRSLCFSPRPQPGRHPQTACPALHVLHPPPLYHIARYRPATVRRGRPDQDDQLLEGAEALCKGVCLLRYQLPACVASASRS